MNHAEVWLNDKKIGEHLGGYLPFTFELSNEIDFDGINILEVKLSNIDNPIIGPKPLEKLDFNTYGGLYRGVSLLIKNPLHITDEIHANEVASGGVFVTYPKVSVKESHIEVKTHIANTYKDKKAFIIKNKLFFNQELVSEISGSIEKLAGNSKKQYSQN